MRTSRTPRPRAAPPSTAPGSVGCSFSAPAGFDWPTNAGTLTLTNSTVINNTSPGYGGGIGNIGGLTLTNSTVSGNTASDGDARWKTGGR
jgi:hypothetical protein